MLYRSFLVFQLFTKLSLILVNFMLINVRLKLKNNKNSYQSLSFIFLKLQACKLIFIEPVTKIDQYKFLLLFIIRFNIFPYEFLNKIG